LNEIVALHPILAGAPVSEMQRILSTDGVIVQFPEIGEVEANAEPHRPMKIAAIDWRMWMAF
jgi:hypothetical protein